MGAEQTTAQHFVQVENVEFSYGEDGPVALDNVSLSIDKGSFACLLGPSGCGKSTLLTILSGLATPSKGRVTIDGKLLYEDGRMVADSVPRLGYMFQDSRLLPWRTARQNIELALRAADIPKSNWRDIVDNYLEMCGIADYADAWPGNLSGGQRQRVAIARALAINPSSILMDEPFSTLDEVTARFLRRELLELWQRTGQTIVFVTHSIREAVFLAENIFIMTKGPGRILEERRIEVPRPRGYEDPALTKIEGDIVGSVLRHWGYYDDESEQDRSLSS